MTRSFYWTDHSTAEFASRDLSETVVILPIAAVEQHGPHLPVQVDATINKAIIDRMVPLLDANADVLILPAISIGKSDEHLAFPGTLTLSAQTLRLVWLDIARSVKRAGGRKMILFNSHGGQISLMEMTCRDIRVELDMLAVACSWFRIAPIDDLFSSVEIVHGIHGGDIETSMMLAIAPELVAMDKAEDFVPLTVDIENSGSPLTAEGAVGFGWQAQDLHPAGVCGNAANADTVKGAEVLDRAATGLLRLIEATGKFDMKRLTSETRFSVGR